MRGNRPRSSKPASFRSITSCRRLRWIGPYSIPGASCAHSVSRIRCVPILLFSAGIAASFATPPAHLPAPRTHADTIAFGYAGDLWTVLAMAVEHAPHGRRGIETARCFLGWKHPGFTATTTEIRCVHHSVTAAFPIASRTTQPRILPLPGRRWQGHRLSLHRQSASRYTQLYSVPAKGGIATLLPLPMLTRPALADGKQIAYTPCRRLRIRLHVYVSWGNYRGGRASVIWLTSLPASNPRRFRTRSHPIFRPSTLAKITFSLDAKAHRHFQIRPGFKMYRSFPKQRPDIRSLPPRRHARLRPVGRNPPLRHASAKTNWCRLRWTLTCRVRPHSKRGRRN